jgi:hypothetical protein
LHPPPNQRNERDVSTIEQRGRGIPGNIVEIGSKRVVRHPEKEIFGQRKAAEQEEYDVGEIEGAFPPF